MVVRERSRIPQVIDLADVRLRIDEQRGDHPCNVFHRDRVLDSRLILTGPCQVAASGGREALCGTPRPEPPDSVRLTTSATMLRWGSTCRSRAGSS